MNEETNTTEPLAAILAEMRASSLATVRDWADRIEAAAEREYEDVKNYFAKLHDGPSMICTAKNCAVRNIGLSLAASPRKFDEAAPGNAAAMREAQEWAAQFVELGVDDDLGADGQNLTTAAEMARDALAAPARNVDRFNNATEAGLAYRNFLWERAGRVVDIDENTFFANLVNWLFAPAEGGAR